MKFCRHCGMQKPDTAFYPSLPSKCKACKTDQQAAWRSKTAEDRAAYWRTYRANSRDVVAAAQRRYYELNKERSYRKAVIRKARKFGGRQVPYQRSEIFRRDEFTCKLCKRPIDMTIRHPHPMSPSLDHKTPLWMGGDDAPWNVRAAHLRCNLRKGQRVGEAATKWASEPT